MLKEVTDFLTLHATPEYTQVAVETLGVFDDYDYQDHEQDMLNAVMGEDDDVTTVQDVHYLLQDHVNKLLAMHNITLIEDAVLGVAMQILKGVQAMQFWEDKQTLLDALQADLSPDECFATLVEEVAGLPVSITLDTVVDFDDAFLKRLAKQLAGELPEEAADDDTPFEQLVQLKNYHLFLNNDKLLGIRLIKLGYRIGAPFERYLNKVRGKLSGLEDVQFAHELMVLLLMGRDTWMSPTQAWRDLNHLVELELPSITAIDVELKNLWSAFDRFTHQAAPAAPL